MQILKANKEFLPNIVKMGREFFHEAKWQDYYKWDDKEAEIALTDLLENPNVAMFIAIEDKPIGMVAGMIYPLWYNPQISAAQELYLYVEPEKRRSISGIGHKLKLKLEDEFRLRGANTMIMGSVDSMPPLADYYARCGYSPSERTYIKRM